VFQGTDSSCEWTKSFIWWPKRKWHPLLLTFVDRYVVYLL